MPCFFGDGAIRLRADVEKQLPFLATVSTQLMDERLGSCGTRRVRRNPRSESKPKCPSARARRRRVSSFPAFNVEGRRIGGHGLLLVGQAPAAGFAPRNDRSSTRRTAAGRRGMRLADPPVEVHEVRMVLVDDFAGESKPVVDERPGRVRATLRDDSDRAPFRRWLRRRAGQVHGRRRAVESGGFRRHVAHVGSKGAATAHTTTNARRCATRRRSGARGRA